jgi:hypothetical protein
MLLRFSLAEAARASKYARDGHAWQYPLQRFQQTASMQFERSVFPMVGVVNQHDRDERERVGLGRRPQKSDIMPVEPAQRRSGEAKAGAAPSRARPGTTPATSPRDVVGDRPFEGRRRADIGVERACAKAPCGRRRGDDLEADLVGIVRRIVAERMAGQGRPAAAGAQHEHERAATADPGAAGRCRASSSRRGRAAAGLPPPRSTVSVFYRSDRKRGGRVGATRPPGPIELGLRRGTRWSSASWPPPSTPRASCRASANWAAR